MSRLGKKEGLATRQEIKFLVDLAMGNVELNFIYSAGIKLVLPAVINAIDNKVGDKLPEPWQTHTENLITSVYEALQDKVITDEELNQILEDVSQVLAAEIDIPLLEESDEILAFEYLLKFLATQVRMMLSKKFKKEE